MATPTLTHTSTGRTIGDYLAKLNTLISTQWQYLTLDEFHWVDAARRAPSDAPLTDKQVAYIERLWNKYIPPDKRSIL